MTVCLIAPNFNIEDVDPELTADGISSFCSVNTITNPPTNSSVNAENFRLADILRTTPPQMQLNPRRVLPTRNARLPHRKRLVAHHLHRHPKTL